MIEWAATVFVWFLLVWALAGIAALGASALVDRLGSRSGPGEPGQPGVPRQRGAAWCHCAAQDLSQRLRGDRCRWAGGIMGALKRSFVAEGRLWRDLWPWAYGVPWGWILDRQWRNKTLFRPVPWHCAICGGEWLPNERPAIKFHARYGYWDECGEFHDYEPVLGSHEGRRVYGWWTPAFGGVWYPSPGQATDVMRQAHAWHFVECDRPVPTPTRGQVPTPTRGQVPTPTRGQVPTPTRGQVYSPITGRPMTGRDCTTGALYLRKDRRPWGERAEYRVRRAWAIARGAGVVLILRLLVVCAAVTQWLPWPLRPIMAMDTFTRWIFKNGPPWGWTAYLFVRRRRTGNRVGPLMRLYGWTIRTGSRARRWIAQAATFWQRRHAIWAAMPWPWAEMDDLSGILEGQHVRVARRGLWEHIAACWRGAGIDMANSYFLAGGIEFEPYPEPFGGLNVVIRTGYVDTNTGAEIEVPLGTCLDGEAGPGDPVSGACSPSTLGTAVVTVQGVEFEADVLEGGALRVRGAASEAGRTPSAGRNPPSQEAT